MSAHPNAEFLRALADGKTVEAHIVGSDEEWLPLMCGARTSAETALLHPAMWSNVKYEFRVQEDACTLI